MKKTTLSILFILTVILTHGLSIAQTPKATPPAAVHAAAKPAGDEIKEIKLGLETSLRLRESSRKFEAKANEATIKELSLKLEQAELEKLKLESEKLKQESFTAYALAAQKAGIPGDQLEKYEGKFDEGGYLVIRRKTDPPATPPAKP